LNQDISLLHEVVDAICEEQPYPVKKTIVEKPPRNSAGFCGGGQGLSWAVEPRKEEEYAELIVYVPTDRTNFLD
jgi:hypothetical protein